MPSQQRIIKNRRESEVQIKYKKMGYSYLKKGWPDFLFYKGDEIIMVEVKRPLKTPTDKMGLSSHQIKMRELLSPHFLYRIEYVD